MPNQGTWAQVKTLVDHGHDVFSHSWNHACLTSDTNLAQSCDPTAPLSVDFATELGKAGDTLRTQTGLSNDFFIFPYDVCDPAAITYLKNAGYLGARCGNAAINMATVADGFSVDYDVFGPSYSYYFGQGACAKTAAGTAPVQWTTLPADYTDACRLFVLNGYVDNVIAAKGWGVREMHGFDPVDLPNGGWETVTLADYRTHLDYLVTKENAGALWIDGPTRVLRYAFARNPQTCAAPTIATGSTLHFGAPSAACQKVTTTLSYRVSTTDGSDPALLGVEQAGALLPVRKVSAGHFVVDADPTKGDAVLVQ
jgi:peptidoglycan/xylan/chitin deacetylase (PgdA/CDA1 family)